MRWYEVNYYDYRNGAESAIDVIEVEDDYTVDDYVNDCRNNDSDGTFEELVENGKFSFYEIKK